jgi:hypothetical protein
MGTDQRPGTKRSISALSRWIQKVDFSGCRIKSGMTENFVLPGYFKSIEPVYQSFLFSRILLGTYEFYTGYQ